VVDPHALPAVALPLEGRFQPAGVRQPRRGQGTGGVAAAAPQLHCPSHVPVRRAAAHPRHPPARAGRVLHVGQPLRDPHAVRDRMEKCVLLSALWRVRMEECGGARRRCSMRAAPWLALEVDASQSLECRVVLMRC
jgi:hypothetical protein